MTGTPADRRITVLADNSAGRRGLLGEHGLAIWIDLRSHRVLFDTGQGHVLCTNARLLGVPLGRADAVVLSHGSFDSSSPTCTGAGPPSS